MVQATLLGGYHAAPASPLPRKVDILYLDTTYCDPKHSFPPQEVLIEEVVKMVKNTMRNKDVLFLFGSYSIGKERVFMEVAQRLGVKMHVSSTKFRMMATFGLPMQTMAKVTTKAKETRFHVVPMNHISFNRMETRLSNEKTFSKIVAFQPTGWTFKGGPTTSSAPLPTASACTVRTKKNMTIVSVPYSEHSNFEELKECIRCLQPRRIIPTVNCSSHEAVTKQLQMLRQH
jgi:DNA cross-link repair 1A protein